VWLRRGILSQNPKRVCVPKVRTYLEREGGKGGIRKRRVINRKDLGQQVFLGVKTGNEV